MPPDFWTNAGVLLATVVAALAGYYGPRFLGSSGAKKVDHVVAGIGMEFGSREQMERQIAILTRIAVSVEILADKRQTEFEEIQRDLLERMDAQERREHEERQRRPPRRP